MVKCSLLHIITLVKPIQNVLNVSVGLNCIFWEERREELIAAVAAVETGWTQQEICSERRQIS